MIDASKFQELSPCSIADFLTRDQVMDMGIKPLWTGAPRIAGPAFTVRLDDGDNLMLHAAIYRAPRGSIIVVDGGSNDFAVAGGNVCAVAQRHGIAGFIIDGVIRDIAEAQKIGFPIYGRGVMPIPGAKELVGKLNEPIQCGGIGVSGGDIVIADQEGIVVVSQARAEEIYAKAAAKAAKDAAETLDIWEKNHRDKIESLLRAKGYSSEK